MGKAVMILFRKDVVWCEGSLQVCIRQPAGVESGLHSTVDLFGSDELAAIIWNSTKNTFNKVNRKGF